MLVLARKLHERIRVTLPDGRFGWIEAVDIDRGKMRVGLTFPNDVLFAREELLPPSERKETANGPQEGHG